ncbi:imm11 family protein [Hahella ganghwensis]|uniref:imm11 family protein n=1 Tax=Hahella ganghwensis TaxID=286420 RepID=UPI000363456A|nr:DUF1629 domain-containing protein [Hahella ganghwensis]
MTQETRYYFIDNYKRLDRDFCFIESPVEEIRLASWKITDGESIKAEYPEGAAVKMSDRGGRVLSDFIGTKTLCLIVSKRVKELIEGFVQGSFEYLPLSIINHKDRLETEDYFYINPLGSYDCLNYDESEIDYLDGDKDRIIGVDRFVLSRQKMASIPDLFRIKEDPSEYVISQRLLDALRSMDPEPTNLVVEEIEVSE